MPVDWSKYPNNWRVIALDVKVEADWQCEKCGKQCRRPGEKFDTHKRTAFYSLILINLLIQFSFFI